jgi:phosphinothricin acetyltransferase
VIRPARPEDAAAIAAIWNPWIRDTAVTFTTEEKTVAGLQALIEAREPTRAFLVTETKDGVQGFATYGQFRAGPGYARSLEHSILLAPTARGQGLGQALMAALTDSARAQGGHVLIGGVSGENPDGAAFHAAMGFTLIARVPEVGFKFGRYMDLLLYQKILT